MMWNCSVRPDSRLQNGVRAPVVVIELSRGRWDFCSCPACELAVDRLDRFDGLCRLVDDYAADLRRRLRAEMDVDILHEMRVRVGREIYTPAPATSHPIQRGPSFTVEPGGLEVVPDDRPIRHRRQRMAAVWEAS